MSSIDSYRRMHAIVHSQMDQISGWARLQDDMKASFEQATGVIRQLREGNDVSTQNSRWPWQTQGKDAE